MEAFLQNYFVWIVGAGVVLAFVIKLASLLKKAKKIDREGVVADAVISRVEYENVPDGSDGYIIYASYTDENGVQRESKAGLFITPEYQEGEQVKIRFLPGSYDLVRIVKDRPFEA